MRLTGIIAALFLASLLAVTGCSSSSDEPAHATHYPRIGQGPVNGVIVPCYQLPNAVTCSAEEPSPPQPSMTDHLSVKVFVIVIAGVIACIFALCAFFGSFFTITTKEAGVIERFGKFSRVATEGLNFKFPFVESLAYTESLNMQLMDVPVRSKTKDDATVTIPIRVQYYVLADKVKEAYYELDDPEDQIRAHVENVILSFIPKLDLDDTYLQEDQIAGKVKGTLTSVMAKFGYCIENALVIRIEPAEEVVNAMNAINAARREKIATEAKAAGEKVLLIAHAEGEKEAQILAGEGVAGEQKAIVDGLRDSLKDFEQGTGVTPNAAMALIMMARYFDALKEMGAQSNTIMVPHSPSVVSDLFSQIRESIISADLVKQK